MRRTFVVEEGTILLETGMGLKKTQRTPPIAHHCTLSLTRLVHLLTRPSPGRVAYRVRCAPVRTEQASCGTCCGKIRGSAGRDPPS